MTRFDRAPRSFLRLIHHPPRLAYALGLGPVIGRLVLLLTTIGRKTGLKRVTPLQYEEIDGVLYVAAARGLKSDWVRNIQANPNIEVQIKTRLFPGIAEVISDPIQIADFLEVRLQRHPRMISAMLRAEGLPSKLNRAQLEALGGQITMVALRETAPGH